MNLLLDLLLHSFIWLMLDVLKINNLIFKSLMLSSFLFTCLIVFLGKNYKLNNYKYIICLGHKLKNNHMSIDLINRLNKTIMVKKEDSIFVLTGGITKGNTLSEAYVMNHYLKSMNVKNTILLEDESKTTIENIKNCLIKYPEIKDSNVLIVSNNYHLLRAKRICYQAGIKNVKAIGISAMPLTFMKQILIEKYCLIFNK